MAPLAKYWGAVPPGSTPLTDTLDDGKSNQVLLIQYILSEIRVSVAGGGRVQLSYFNPLTPTAAIWYWVQQ